MPGRPRVSTPIRTASPEHEKLLASLGIRSARELFNFAPVQSARLLVAASRGEIPAKSALGDVKAASQNRAGGVVIIDLDKLGGDGGIEIHGWNVALMDSSDFIF